MENKKKLISVMLVLVLSVVIFTGCFTGCSKKEETPKEKLTEIVQWYYGDHSYQRKVLNDLTDEIPKLISYMPIEFEPCTVEGRIMGLPCGLNCTALFYNKEILTEAGMVVPLDWDMLFRSAKAVSGENMYGYDGANGMGVVDLTREQNPELDFDITMIPQAGQAISMTGSEIFGVMNQEHKNKKEAIMFLQFIIEKKRLSSYIDRLNMLALREGG